MKRGIINLIKGIIPYRRLPKGLKTVVAQLAHTTTPRHRGAVSGSAHALDCVIAYNDLGGYAIPLSSIQRPVAQQVMKGRVHEKDTIACVVKHCGNGDVVHAGTYFGDFLPALSAGLADGAKLWAFEPNLENYRCAAITVILNDLKNVELKHAGLGSGKSVQKLLIQTADGTNLGGTSRIVDKAEAGQSTDIEIVSIDSVIPRDRQVSVIQLDVEGYEKQVLEGAIETIKRCRPVLIMEINNIDLTKSDWLKENILSIGYEVEGRVHMNSVLIPKAK